MTVDLPAGWSRVLAGEFDKPYFSRLAEFVDTERASVDVYPPESDVFNALRLADFPSARVVLLGQDPYHDAGQAHGLCFSVRPGIVLPPSLRNIFVERRLDIGLPVPGTGCLETWATQGIVMLNAVLTVRAHQANSHQGKGWETFTDAVIAALNARESPLVFVLWGANAQKKRALINDSRHRVVESAHPSPLSARNGFFGSRPFSAVNSALRELGLSEIDWRLPGEN